MHELTIAKIGRPHGVHGWVRAICHNPDSTLLEHTDTVTLQWPDGVRRQFDVSARRHTGDHWLLKLKGIDDRDAAQLLTHALLFVSGELLEPLDDDEFYYAEVVGFDVFDTDGQRVGSIREVTSTNIDIFVVETPQGDYMVPVLDDFVETIDRQGRRVVIVPLQDEMKSDG